MKKRLLVAGVFMAALALSAAGPAAANKNRQEISAECSNGQPATVLVNVKANGNSAVPVVGGGSFKTTELRVFLQGTSVEVFSETTNFPKQPTVTCTGTFFSPEVEATVDFIVSGVLRPGK
jgi:hypothetical protein